MIALFYFVEYDVQHVIFYTQEAIMAAIFTKCDGLNRGGPNADRTPTPISAANYGSPSNLLRSGPITTPHEPSHAQQLKFAWAAGFIDGDGCITAVTQRYRDRATPSTRIRVIVVQNDYHTLAVLKTVLGERGALNVLRRQQEQNRQPFQLQYDGQHALAVIAKILPYLVRKRAEALACQTLAIEGELSRFPGCRGFSKEVLQRREYWVKRLRRMK